ncbi:MAG: preprotein translocase subunit SecG [Paludibacteraceae bacterium]
MIYTIITSFIVIASVLLVGVVLVQNSKGGGLSSGFAAQNQIMGVKKTTDFIEKATWILVGVVVFLSVVSAGFIPTQNKIQSSELDGQIENVMNTNPTNTPDFGGSDAAEK